MATPVTDPAILEQLNAPRPVTDPEILKKLEEKHEPSSAIGDFFKSIPRGLMSGFSNAASALGQATQAEMGQSPDVPSGPEATAIMEKNVTGPLHQPEGRAGRFGAALGEAAGNPATYIAPGGAALKALAATGSAIGGEGAGQLFEGSGYETPARLVGSFAGGLTGSSLRAAPSVNIPTRAALESAADTGYTAARNLGLEIAPHSVSGFATRVGQTLQNDGINDILAPKAFGILARLEKPPAGSVATVSNLETVRRSLGHAAKDFSNPTERLAASTAIRHLDDYMASIPAKDVLAGDAAEASRLLTEARGNYAAAKHSEQVGDALDAADLQAASTHSGRNLDNATRQKFRSILTSDKRSAGYTEDELAQLERIVRGTAPANLMRTAGNYLGGGGGLGGLATAFVGTHTVGPAGWGLPLVGTALKKLADRSTMRQVENLDAMVRSRSPLAQSLMNSMPPQTGSPRSEALARALLSATNAQ